MSNVGRKVNPYDYMRPVMDRDKFAGRELEMNIVKEEINKLVDSNSTPVVALSGERRVGKTSLLLRIEELCKESNIISARTMVSDSVAANHWEFWRELFSVVIQSLNRMGIEFADNRDEKIGFRKLDDNNLSKKWIQYKLHFLEAYYGRISVDEPISLTLLKDDYHGICRAANESGYNGLVIMIDEAHKLVNNDEIQAQLRNAVSEIGSCGLVFAGEPEIGSMFNNPQKPFYHQARVIEVKNYTSIDDVAECAIKPLSQEERVLISPMTVDYLARLSQGKPNQIRLICSSIYSNYAKDGQDDLNITMRTLQDVMEVISSTYTEYDLNKIVNKIQELDTIDLECLYRITKYPNWELQDIVELDECFRGDQRSEPAEKRRRKILDEKKEKFIGMGLLRAEQNRCILAGDEFLYLYLRFQYEMRKFGELSRRLKLGRAPNTAFSEKVDKLTKSLAFELGRYPRIEVVSHINQYIDPAEIRRRLIRRFEVLTSILQGKSPKDLKLEKEEFIEIMGDCTQVCELVEKSGPHHLVSILVRNGQNVNELIHVEMYFDPEIFVTLVSSDTEKVLKRQADLAKVWIEGFDDLKLATLPTLTELLVSVGSTVEDLLDNLDDVSCWRIGSVQHIVSGENDKTGKKDEPDSEQEYGVDEDWLRRYDSGDEKGAIDILDEKISKYGVGGSTQKLARYYNDRGYIKSTTKVDRLDEAENDLNRAISLFNIHLSLSILNLAVIYIDQKEYEKAINIISEVLFLATSREYIMAAYLKLRVVPCTLAPISKLEQHPANVIEAAYINLAYAQFYYKKVVDAISTIDEALALLPESFRLKHAKARILLADKKAYLADDIFLDLGNMKIDDGIIQREVALYKEKYLRKKYRPGKRK
ncbi:hypothetical protein ACFLRP_03245 [Bacteroidota bacterium]